MRRARKLVLYRSGKRRKRWRWRLVAPNGRNMANGSEGYERRGECLDAATKTVRAPYKIVYAREG